MTSLNNFPVQVWGQILQFLRKHLSIWSSMTDSFLEYCWGAKIGKTTIQLKILFSGCNLFNTRLGVSRSDWKWLVIYFHEKTLNFLFSFFQYSRWFVFKIPVGLLSSFQKWFEEAHELQNLRQSALIMSVFHKYIPFLWL